MSDTNEQKIINRVKLMLGGSILHLEISDENISELIAIAMDTVQPYAVDYKYITFPFSTSVDMSKYNISEVVRLMAGTNMSSVYGVGNEYTFDFTQWTVLDRIRLTDPVSIVANSVTPDVDIPFEFDSETKLLMISPGVTSSNITAECVPNISSVNDLRDASTLKWVYLYSLALSKEVVGRTRSKAKSSNIPVELDGDTLLSEAATEKLSLETSLLGDAMGPVAMLR